MQGTGMQTSTTITNQASGAGMQGTGTETSTTTTGHTSGAGMQGTGTETSTTATGHTSGAGMQGTGTETSTTTTGHTSGVGMSVSWMSVRSGMLLMQVPLTGWRETYLPGSFQSRLSYSVWAAPTRICMH